VVLELHLVFQCSTCPTSKLPCLFEAFEFLDSPQNAMSRPSPPPVWAVIEREEFEVTTGLKRPSMGGEALPPSPQALAAAAAPSPPAGGGVEESPPVAQEKLDYCGWILKRRENMTFSIMGATNVWRKRWLRLCGTHLHYYEDPGHVKGTGQARDIIWLAPGTRVELTWPQVAKGSDGSGGGSAPSSPNLAGGAAPAAAAITPTPPPASFSVSELATIVISNPATADRYHFAWPITREAGAAARRAVERWVEVLVAAAEGDKREGVNFVTSGQTSSGLKLRKGLKIASGSPVALLNSTSGGGGGSGSASGSGRSLVPSSLSSNASSSAAPAVPPGTPSTRGASEAASDAVASASAAAPPSVPSATPPAAAPAPTPPDSAPQSAPPLDAPFLPPENPFFARLTALAEQVESQAESNDAWLPNGSRGGVQFWKTTDGSPGCKGVGHLPYTRSAIVSLIADIARRGEYDEQFDGGRTCGSSEAGGARNVGFTYMRFKGKAMVSGRDFFILTHAKVDPTTGVFSLITTSIGEEEVARLVGGQPTGAGSLELPRSAEKAGYVRGEIVLGGWLVRPVPGMGVERAAPPPHSDPMPLHAAPEVDSEGCIVTYLQRSDLKGSIPSWVTAGIVAQQARLILSVGDRLKALTGGPNTLAARAFPPIVNSVPLRVQQQQQRGAGAGEAPPPVSRSLPSAAAPPDAPSQRAAAIGGSAVLGGASASFSALPSAAIVPGPKGAAPSFDRPPLPPPPPPPTTEAAAAAPSTARLSSSLLLLGCTALVALCAAFGRLLFPGSFVFSVLLAGVFGAFALSSIPHLALQQRLAFLGIHIPLLCLPLPGLAGAGLAHGLLAELLLKPATRSLLTYSLTLPALSSEGCVGGSRGGGSGGGGTCEVVRDVAIPPRLQQWLEPVLLSQLILVLSSGLAKCAPSEEGLRDFVGSLPAALRALLGSFQ
jgi:hypothetical protein